MFQRHAQMRGSILSAVLISLATVLSIAALLGLFGWWIWGKIENFPEDAKPEVVISAHQQTIDRIHAITAVETSRFQAAARLESADFPNELLYLELVEESDNLGDDDDKLEVIRRVEFSGHSWTIMNGSGYGTLDTPSGERAVLLVKQDIANPNFSGYWLAMFPRPAVAVAHSQ